MIASFVILAYILLVVYLGFRSRGERTPEGYLMDSRRSSPYFVAAGVFGLIGCAELVSATSLGYLYGLSGAGLFAGYTVGLIVLALVVRRVRASQLAQSGLSIVDFADRHYGHLTGTGVLLVSILAFFLIIMVQLTAGASILSSLLPISYHWCVLIIVGPAVVYLFSGGFHSVLRTDVLQGVARLLLVPTLVVLAVQLPTLAVDPPKHNTGVLPQAVAASMLITGMFSVVSAADIWQRVYAAKSEKDARNGLLLSSGLIALFGGSLAALGMAARHRLAIPDADHAFSQIALKLLPVWAMPLAGVLVLSTAMSTIDSEIFLLSTLMQRKVRHYVRGGGQPSDSIGLTRLGIAIVAIVSVAIAWRQVEVLDLYLWLLNSLLILAPLVIGPIVLRTDRVAGQISFIGGATCFLVLTLRQLLTPESCYLTLAIGMLAYFGTGLVRWRLPKQQ